MLTFKGKSVSSGTSDIVILDEENQTLRIYDYKNGKGIPVDVEENYQLILYALGAYYLFKANHTIKNIEVGVLQPRAFHPDGEYRYWEFPVGDFADKWGPLFSKVVTQVLGEEHPPTAGESQCRWCGIKGDCTAQMAKGFADAANVFSITGGKVLEEVKANTLRHPESLSDEQLATILEAKPFVESWLKAVKSHVEKQFSDGKLLPGFKLVSGRGSRKWNLEQDDLIVALKAVANLKPEKFLDTKFKSVAQFEKSAKNLMTKEQWAEFSTHIIKTEGAATVVHESDKRKSIAGNINEVFSVTGTDDFLD